MDRDRLLTMDDAELSAFCRIEFFKGSGHGGQKRNKTSSAVRVTLTEYEISAEDCTERSQMRNRSNALRKLKMLLALKLREAPLPPERFACAKTSPEYPLCMARIFDRLHETGFDHRKAAETLGVTPSGLLRKLAADPQLWQEFQKERDVRELPKLQIPGQ